MFVPGRSILLWVMLPQSRWSWVDLEYISHMCHPWQENVRLQRITNWRQSETHFIQPHKQPVYTHHLQSLKCKKCNTQLLLRIMRKKIHKYMWFLARTFFDFDRSWYIKVRPVALPNWLNHLGDTSKITDKWTQINEPVCEGVLKTELIEEERPFWM